MLADKFHENVKVSQKAYGSSHLGFISFSSYYYAKAFYKKNIGYNSYIVEICINRKEFIRQGLSGVIGPRKIEKTGSVLILKKRCKLLKWMCHE